MPRGVTGQLGPTKPCNSHLAAAGLPLSLIHEAYAKLQLELPRSPCFEVQDAEVRPGRLFVKAENLMPTGSFKIRGATYRLLLLSEEERRRGVVAYSTGNHAQAVAKAARDIGVKATIVMSPDVPALKIRSTEGWGARVLMAEPTSHARRAMAEDLAARNQMILIPPYDDPHIMAGQASIGLELLEQLRDAQNLCVYVPIGGGGLIAGIAAALKQTRSDVRIIGVEPELENDAWMSFRSGKLTSLKGPSGSIADALKVQQLGQMTWPNIRLYVDDIETVSETEIADASLYSFSALKLVVEPGGAVALAAARRACTTERHTALAILCGGNVSIERLQHLRSEAQR